MPVLVLGESNYAGLIPADTVLPAIVTSCTHKKTPFINDDGTEAWQYEFAFQISDPGQPFDGTRLWGKTSDKFVNNPNCRLYSWAQEILGVELEAGFELDTDFLAGNTVRVVVGVREWQDKNDVKQERNYVADVMRAKANAYAVSDDDAPF